MDGCGLGEERRDANDVRDDDAAADSQARDPCRPRESAEDTAERARAEQQAELRGAHAEGPQDQDGQENLNASPREGCACDAREERKEQALAAHEGQSFDNLRTK